MGVISLGVVWLLQTLPLSQKETLAGVSVIQARSNFYATQPSNLPHIFESKSILAGSKVFFSDITPAASYIPALTLSDDIRPVQMYIIFGVIIFFIYKL